MRTERFVSSLSEQEEVYLPQYSHFKIAEGFIKLYTEGSLRISKLMAQLTQSEIVVLMFLAENMRMSDNECYTTKNVVQDFITTMETVGKKYQAVTVKRAFQSLKERGILLTTPETRGVYKVNPAYLYKDVEQKRVDLFKKIRMEQAAGKAEDSTKEIVI